MKFRTWLAPAAMALALAACGQQQQAEQAPPPAAAPPAAEAPAAPAAAATEVTPEIQAAIAALPAPYNQGDYLAGQKVFAQCRSCHSIEAGGRNLVGPNLHGLFGRTAGSVEGFAYSDALKGAGFTWDAEQLNNWLTNPTGFLPGNRMAFAGVRDETQRRDLIAYLKVESAS